MLLFYKNKSNKNKQTNKKPLHSNQGCLSRFSSSFCDKLWQLYICRIFFFFFAAISTSLIVLGKKRVDRPLYKTKKEKQNKRERERERESDRERGRQSQRERERERERERVGIEKERERESGDRERERERGEREREREREGQTNKTDMETAVLKKKSAGIILSP